jgi:hypothetical protein
MATRYSIENTVSGQSLGIYDADSEHGALEAMARDAGYNSYAEACEVAAVPDGEIVVVPYVFN